MSDEKKCKIVQDLLPNYIENLTTTETNSFIESHVKGCVDCSSLLKNMKKDLYEKSNTENQKEIKFLKKYNFKLNFFRNLLLIILLIFIAIITRRFIIFNSLANKAEAIINYDNYYVKRRITANDTILTLEKYHKNEKSIEILRTYHANYEKPITSIITYYADDKENLALTEAHSGDTTQYFYETDNPYNPNVEFFSNAFDKNFLKNLALSFKTGIQKVTLNGVECYKYSEDGIEKYVDINTGLIIRVINNTDSIFYLGTVSYTFGNVTDEDVAKPSTEGYTQQYHNLKNDPKFSDIFSN